MRHSQHARGAQLFNPSSEAQIAEWVNRYFHFSDFPDVDMFDLVRAIDAGYWAWNGTRYQTTWTFRREILGVKHQRHRKTHVAVNELVSIPYFDQRRNINCHVCSSVFYSKQSRNIHCDNRECKIHRKDPRRKHLPYTITSTQKATIAINNFLY